MYFDDLDIEVTVPNLSKVQTLSKGLEILEVFMERRTSFGVAELSHILGMPESTVYRMLATLEYHGYLVQDSKSKKYSLGLKLYRMSDSCGFLSHSLEQIYAAVEELRDAVNETVNFAIRERNYSIYLHTLYPTHSLRPVYQPNASYPCYCTSIGKSLLLDISKKELKELFPGDLPKPTPNTITDMDELYGELQSSRKRGYTYDNEECEIGINCYAAPVRASSLNNAIIGGINVPTPSSRLTPELSEAICRNLLRITADLAKKL